MYPIIFHGITNTLSFFLSPKKSRGSPMSTGSMSEMSSHSPSIPVGQVRFLGVGLVADPRTSKLWQPDIARTMEKFWGRFGLISILPYRIFEFFRISQLNSVSYLRIDPDFLWLVFWKNDYRMSEELHPPSIRVRTYMANEKLDLMHFVLPQLIDIDCRQV